MKTISFLTITLIMMLTSVSTAQIFKLDSIIYEQFHKDKLPEILKKNNNKNRLPVLVNRDLITLFNLKDTIIDGLQINYFTTRQEMAKKYSLKKDKKVFECVLINLVDVSANKIKVRMAYGFFKCEKYLFRDGEFLIINNGLFNIEYYNKNYSQGSTTIKEYSY